MALTTGSDQSHSEDGRRHWRHRMNAFERDAGATREVLNYLRFMGHVPVTQLEYEDGCWEWAGARNESGYGRAMRDGHDGAHRVSWLFAHGPVPAGLHVCHRCDNPPCINPAHLFLGTPSENGRDRRDKARQRGVSLIKAQVLEIREAAAAGAPVAELSSRFGVPIPTISRIVHRETWADI